MLIDSGVLPAHAVELLVSGSEDEMHEHWYRAVDVYQKLYTCRNVPCSVQVIVAAPTSQRMQSDACLAPYTTLRSMAVAAVYFAAKPMPCYDCRWLTFA